MGKFSFRDGSGQLTPDSHVNRHHHEKSLMMKKAVCERKVTCEVRQRFGVTGNRYDMVHHGTGQDANSKREYTEPGGILELVSQDHKLLITNLLSSMKEQSHRIHKD
ncbi:hypothetical protein RUM43_001796 [Polyplax serrata]|uniref:Uncharacterized protein n=1 Tax=Polyplax serrata TaxID=468196 RepID=A0AAN8XQY6_POLSC